MGGWSVASATFLGAELNDSNCVKKSISSHMYVASHIRAHCTQTYYTRAPQPSFISYLTCHTTTPNIIVQTYEFIYHIDIHKEQIYILSIRRHSTISHKLFCIIPCRRRRRSLLPPHDILVLIPRNEGNDMYDTFDLI